MPTIGKIVHYTVDADQVLPAIITKVWNQTCINVEVFGRYDVQDRIKTSVVQGTGGCEWSWPPRDGVPGFIKS